MITTCATRSCFKCKEKACIYYQNILKAKRDTLEEVKEIIKTAIHNNDKEASAEDFIIVAEIDDKVEAKLKEEGK